MTGSRLPHRLDPDDYIGPLTAHLIIVTRQRRQLFREDALAKACLSSIERSIQRFGAILHAYCLMPDHVHLLLEIPARISLEQVVRHFKSLSGYLLKQASGELAWQDSYYDHILRREEALEDVANYIWANPVTAGLVEEPSQYAWSGPPEQLQALARPAPDVNA